MVVENTVDLTLILMSALSVLFPQVRSTAAYGLASGLLFLIWFVALIRRERRRGLLNKTLPELYAEARNGRRLRPPPLEMAAMVAVTLSAGVRLFS